MTRFNPHSIEGHYSLELASYWVHRVRPRSVRICTADVEIARAAVRRLAWIGSGLTVEHEHIAEAIGQTLGLHVALGHDTTADVALVPYSRQHYAEPPQARRLVLIGHNALSYKSLLYAGQIHDNVIAQVRWLQRRYQMDGHTGLFGPGFLSRWMLSTAAGPRLAPLHFQFGQRAMARLYSTGGFWWAGYIVVLSGTLRD